MPSLGRILRTSEIIGGSASRSPRTSMKLRELLSGCTVRSVIGDLDAEILGLAYDSREVSAGFLFIAIRGTRMDGNRFVRDAIVRGAAAVVSSDPPAQPPVVPWIQVEDERGVLACIAGNYYGHPTSQLRLAGVTGTNGKTTTAYLLESIVKAAGHGCAILGTIEHRGPGFDVVAERTTPEAPDLERLFRRVVDARWKYAVMEVSSHAIEMKRVAGLRFEAAVFTNLSRDHLDFHGDMESYFQAKKKLFAGLAGPRPRVSVLNMDDPRYDELRSIDPSRVISYGMRSSADVRPARYHFDWDGSQAVYKTPLGELAVRSGLLGTPNLYNIGAAIGAAVGLGFPLDAIGRGVEELPNVPGRFEPVNAGQPFRVIVDYAHTDDALEKVLLSAREITSGKLMVVFGCGGERDRTKRPAMGSVAARLSDHAIVTSDNPRGEDPRTIIQEIEAGMSGSSYSVEIDRREAIRAALRQAKSGDTIVIAGKGHETYQTIGSMSHPFDDRSVTRELLHELVSG